MGICCFPRIAGFAFGAVVLCATPIGNAAEKPMHRATIAFDPETSELRVADAISAANAVSVAPADWIEIQALRVGGQAVGDLVGPIRLSGSDIAGQAVEVQLSGRLPGPSEAPGRFAAFPGGAFLFGADGWLPTAGEGEAVMQITVETPATHRAIVTGDLLEERIGEDVYTASYRFEGDGDDLGVFVGPYVIGEALAGDLRFRTYFPESHASESSAYLEAVAKYVARYAQLIGDYPYSSFSVVSAPIPVGYGLEGMAYVSERILSHPYMRGRSLAHEVLHSWWGSGVAIDYESGNWGEGLTTYQADYALAEERGADAAREMRQEWLRSLSVLPSALDTPVRSFRFDAHGTGQAVGYDKVAMIFHMLRRELGASVFDDGVRAFWESSRGKKAAWSDLQDAFEGVSGRDLDGFFNQWIDRPGLPALALGAVHAEKEGTDHGLTVALEQSEPPYDLSVPIAIETDKGTVFRTIRLNAPEVRVRIALEGRPLAVQVDPDFQIARRLPRGELPASFREALWTAKSVVLVEGETSQTEAAAALGRRLAPEAVQVEPAALGGTDGTVLVLGATAEVGALRNLQLGGEAPAIATEGSGRAWVERDDADRLWLFASADDPEDLDALYALGYYGALSYAAFEHGAAVITGTWPSDFNPLRRSLP
jgi:aminopeptidase N